MNPFKTHPYIYEIEPTNHCPYTCIMCPKGLGKMKRPVGFMAPDTFRVILDQFPKRQKLVRMHHFGEAVLHPRIGEMIQRVKGRGLYTALSLNPATLTPRLNREIIDSGVDLVCFSLDAFTDEGLERIRGIKRPFNACWAMVEDFIEQSRNKGKNLIKVIQMVRLDLNKKDRHTFNEIKLRYPEKDVFLYLSENNGFGNLELVEQTLAGGSRHLLPGTPCRAPFSEVVVLWNGDVVLCCFDYDGFNVIGNIHDKPLSRIWQDKKVKEIRAAFKARETVALPLCHGCFLGPHNYKRGLRRPAIRGIEEEKTILNLIKSLAKPFPSQ